VYTAGKLIYFDPFHFKACINCYIFEAGRPITTSGWSFSFHTMLYGSWLDDFEISSLEKNYPIAGVDYEIVSVKRKYRRILTL
jgi:hypothetical protein